MGVRHQDVVDDREHAAEPGRGGRKSEGSGLGHVIFLEVEANAVDNIGIPDTSCNFFVCIAA